MSHCTHTLVVGGSLSWHKPPILHALALSASTMTLETERLLLRQFQASDLNEYAARIFADPDVMRYLPKRDALPHERAQRTMDFMNEHWTQFPYGPWAVQVKANGELIGHCALSQKSMKRKYCTRSEKIFGETVLQRKPRARVLTLVSSRSVRNASSRSLFLKISRRAK